MCIFVVVFGFCFCKLGFFFDRKLKAESEKLLWKNIGARMEFLAKL